MKMKVDMLESELKQERQSAKLLYNYIPQKDDDIPEKADEDEDGDGDVLKNMGNIQREVQKILNEDKDRVDIATSPIRDLLNSTSRQISPVRLQTSPTRAHTSPAGKQTEETEVDERYLRSPSRSYSFSEQSDIISTRVSEKLDSALAKSRKGKVLPVWRNISPRQKIVKPELKSYVKKKKVTVQNTPIRASGGGARPAVRASGGIRPDFSAEKRDMPFIVGKSTGKSYSVTANIQHVFSLLKAHNPGLILYFGLLLALCTVCSRRDNEEQEGGGGDDHSVHHDALVDFENADEGKSLGKVKAILEKEYAALKA
jgi:hypothetical protein